MRVLIATDGSTAARVGLELARAIDWPAGSELRLVTVVSPGEDEIALWTDEIAGGLRVQVAQVVAQAATLLEQSSSVLERPGLIVSRSVLRGRPASAILDEAAGFGADLVLLGSRGHGAIESMLIGSVTAEVVDHASCPTLVARLPRLDRVMLAHDGSQVARAAEELVAEWPIFRESSITVTSVAGTGLPSASGLSLAAYSLATSDLSQAMQPVIEEHEKIAREAVERLTRAGRRASSQVIQGDAATELVRAALESHADLIVLGTHGRTGLARLLLGGVARNVMHHAPCSVLVVRARRP